MNIILIMVDSLNRHALKLYNPTSICQTPVIDSLAEKSLVFDNHYISSLPCMPARRELTTGRKEFLWRPWGPLEVFDPRLAAVLNSAGYHTGIVTDHYHYWEEQANGYVEDFCSAEFIRGHETDFWKLPEQGPVPAWVEKISEFRSSVHPRQYYANVKNFKGEQDFFPAKVFTTAANWLEDNAAKGDFFLQVESFDVHEPFDVPEPYASMYSDGGTKDDFNIWPPYQMYDDLANFMAQTTSEELAFIESQYLGKVTMVDTWLGYFLKKLDELSLWDDTMVVFTTDHGHDFGQRGVFGKQFPHYDSHANLPLMVYHPEHGTGQRRVDRLTQNVDLFATLLQAAGATVPDENRHSQSFLNSLTEQLPDTLEPKRDSIVYGTFGQGVCFTDGTWTLFKAPVPDKELFSYSTMLLRPLIVDNPVDGRVGRLPQAPVDQGYFDPTVPLPMWKIPITIDPRTRENFLFNRLDDPDQENNLWDSLPDKRNELLGLLKAQLLEEGCPCEQFERLGLDAIEPHTS
ncbi:MAG: sulfatase [Granulosicoccus sp.]|nr:sulfatase [Granulosicoccus sp.]